MAANDSPTFSLLCSSSLYQNLETKETSLFDCWQNKML